MAADGRAETLPNAGKVRSTLLSLVLLLAAAAGFADYPEIQELSPRDLLFKQLQQDLQSYFVAVSRHPDLRAAEEELPPLRLYLFRNPGRTDLFSLAARLNVPYDTLATLNGLGNPGALERREAVLVPNSPGVFAPRTPESSFEEILCSVSSSERSGGEQVTVSTGGRLRPYLFFRGASFTAVERAYFLNILFRFPLPFWRITSGYGPRESPMGGGKEFHQGLDLAAPVGTEVYAARDGEVAAQGYDPVLGNMILLSHEGGYQTVYGHLAQILVGLHQKVRSGMIIGSVGTTGYSTGPHLHFEVRRSGSPRDPLPLLPAQKEEQ
jgi:murein DD-endopeptidase MepM/ murein hydrolase activator NlpD